MVDNNILNNNDNSEFPPTSPVTMPPETPLDVSPTQPTTPHKPFKLSTNKILVIVFFILVAA